MNTKFKAFVVREAESGVFKSAVEERKVDDLPHGRPSDQGVLFINKL